MCGKTVGFCRRCTAVRICIEAFPDYALAEHRKVTRCAFYVEKAHPLRMKGFPYRFGTGVRHAYIRIQHVVESGRNAGKAPLSDRSVVIFLKIEAFAFAKKPVRSDAHCVRTPVGQFFGLSAVFLPVFRNDGQDFLQQAQRPFVQGSFCFEGRGLQKLRHLKCRKYIDVRLHLWTDGCLFVVDEFPVVICGHADLSLLNIVYSLLHIHFSEKDWKGVFISFKPPGKPRWLCRVG